MKEIPNKTPVNSLPVQTDKINCENTDKNEPNILNFLGKPDFSLVIEPINNYEAPSALAKVFMVPTKS